MGGSITPDVIKERMNRFEIVPGDLDVMRAVGMAQKWIAEHPSKGDEDLPWMVDFCDMAIAMLDGALGAGAVDTIFEGGRKSASGLLAAVNELAAMVKSLNAGLEAEILDLTETVPED